MNSKKKFKKAFSLIELIFIIAVIAIISSIAIPKLTNINNKATVSSIKQDINTIITSVESYYLVNGVVDKISDAVNIDSSVWTISDNELKYKSCITITLSETQLTISIDETSSDTCQKLYDNGIQNTTYSLN
jgi:type II secretory pathway pseudopilin PulG